MPNEATVDDILDAYHESWAHGLKAMALYRDGSKQQPAALRQERHQGSRRATRSSRTKIAAAGGRRSKTRVQPVAQAARGRQGRRSRPRWPMAVPSSARAMRASMRRTPLFAGRSSRRQLFADGALAEQHRRRSVPPPYAGPPQRLHAGGARRRPEGLPAHRRVRGRHARRDLHRHRTRRARPSAR